MPSPQLTFDVTSAAASPHRASFSATPKLRSARPVEDATRLRADLRAVGRRHAQRETLLAELFALHLTRHNVVACLAVTRRSDGTLGRGPSKTVADSIDIQRFDPWLTELLSTAAALTEPVVQCTENGEFASMYVPAAGGDFAALVTIVRRTQDAQQRATDIAVAQLFADELEFWCSRRQMAEASQQLANTAAILELVQRVSASASVQAACQAAASALRDHLRCGQVAIGLERRRGGCKLIAVSGVANVDQTSDSAQRLKAALNECAARNQLCAWPPLPAEDSTKDRGDRPVGVHQLPAHRQLAGHEQGLLSVPLAAGDGAPSGALLLVGRRELAAVPEVARFAAAAASPLGGALAAVRRAEGSWWRRTARALLARYPAGKRALAVVLCLAMTAAMLLPLPYKIACRSVAEPVQRKFSVAPHDGLLEATFVEPGDVVRQGELLARMDGRDVHWELAGIGADLTRAEKRRDIHMARHETSETLLAELEISRLDSRAELLNLRAEHLEVTSPIAGVVLAGSLNHRANYPVRRGQVLFEIAPLDALRVEFDIPADEITRVRPGMPVDLTFKGSAEQARGQLGKIRPRSEVRDNRNVFVAEVVIANSDGQLRPGVKGRAKIVGDRQPVAWILFHRAAEQAQLLWPW